MVDNTINISPFFKFEIKSPPRGMTDYDPGALHPDQQERLNEYKLSVIRENVLFLTKHPEFKTILNWITEYIWKIRPRHAIGKIAKRFTVAEEELRRVIKDGIDFTAEELAESEEEDWDY